MNDEVKLTKARAGIRFTVAENQFGYISYNLEEYVPEAAVFVVNESINGSCLVLNRKLVPTKINIVPGIYLIVKVGDLDPVTAIVRWVRNVDEDLFKFGVENTEKRHVIKFK
jgi:hypothetical protein